jgi:hypothetical protein
MNSSESVLIEKMNQALEEVLALGFLVYQNGNFMKADGLIIAARFISNALGSDCKAGLRDRLEKLDKMTQITQTCCDWVI